MPIPIAAILGLGSALIGASASRSASRAQSNAAARTEDLGRDQLTETQRQYDNNVRIAQGIRDDNLAIAGDYRTHALDLSGDTRRNQLAALDPFSGTGAYDAYQYELGLGDRPAGYRGFQETPGFQYAMDRTQGAVEGSAAASGNLFSGATLRALQENASGLTHQYYGNHLNRLAGEAGANRQFAGLRANIEGQYGANRLNALGNFANLGTGANASFGAAQSDATRGLAAGQAQSNAMIGNALNNYGQARAAGAVGTANALLGGIDTGLGVWNYQNRLNAA